MHDRSKKRRTITEVLNLNGNPIFNLSLWIMMRLIQTITLLCAILDLCIVCSLNKIGEKEIQNIFSSWKIMQFWIFFMVLWTLRCAMHCTGEEFVTLIILLSFLKIFFENLLKCIALHNCRSNLIRRFTIIKTIYWI